MKCVLLGLVLMGAALDARAVGSLADVQIRDRDSGIVLPTYRYRGEYWVAGRPGARYSIMIQNRRGERVLAVTAVDGINVITGETGAWNQGGYVFDAGESYEIAGWRKSDAEIAAFNFTAAGQSYAGLTGRPANVGVIGVALFLERPIRVPRVESYVPRLSELSEDSAARAAQGSAGKPESAAPAAAAPSAPPPRSETQAQLSAPAQKLGTGHGARETSYVRTTQFDRLSNTPNEIIKIRYDSFENLVAMGVVRSRPGPPPAPNPFPDSWPRYVPDPPAG
jgi:hypothetical protein